MIPYKRITLSKLAYLMFAHWETKPVKFVSTYRKKQIDVLALTETWLKETDHALIKEGTPPGYAFIMSPAVDRLEAE